MTHPIQRADVHARTGAVGAPDLGTTPLCASLNPHAHSLSPHHTAFLRGVLPCFGPIAEEMWPAFFATVHVAHVRRDTHHEPQSATLGWIVEGLVREYYVSSDGREHNRAFFTEGASFGHLDHERTPAFASLWTQALEDVEALCITSSGFNALCETDPRWHVFARRCAERNLASASLRERELLMLPAELRYRRALERQPELASRVRLYHLASYLGISAEHLSRIRGTRARHRE